MAFTAQTISAGLSKKLETAIPRDKILKAAKDACNGLVKDVLADTRRNIGRNGPMKGSYTPAYAKYKAKFISKGGQAKTAYKATSVNDKGRLSGRAASDFYAANIKTIPGFVGVEFKLTFKSQRSKDVAEGNALAGYDWAGMHSASTATGRMQRKNWINRFKASLGVSGGGSGSFGTGF